MRSARRFELTIVSLLLAIPLLAQKEHRQPLTEAQVDQIREAGIDPNGRIKLYAKFVDEHVDTIKGLTARAHSSARSHRLDDELQDLTALMDELGANLDQYADRKADMLKALKALNEATSRWLDVVRTLPTDPGFDLSRKEALESGGDLSDQVAQLFKEQTDYFALHKDEKGQERVEPK